MLLELKYTTFNKSHFAGGCTIVLGMNWYQCQVWVGFYVKKEVKTLLFNLSKTSLH